MKNTCRWPKPGKMESWWIQKLIPIWKVIEPWKISKHYGWTNEWYPVLIHLTNMNFEFRNKHFERQFSVILWWVKNNSSRNRLLGKWFEIKSDNIHNSTYHYTYLINSHDLLRKTCQLISEKTSDQFFFVYKFQRSMNIF